MKIETEPKLDFDDVLLVPQRSRAASRKEVDLTRNYKFYHSDANWTGTPIVAANMDTTGTIRMGSALQELGCVTCLHKHYEDMVLSDAYTKFLDINNNWLSIGIKGESLEFFRYITEKLHLRPHICIDVANGYTDDFVAFCKKIRDLSWTLGGADYSPIIMAGNVATPEMTTELILHGGVDIVKVGIGPGSACTTRLKTGIGYPQLSAIMECSHAAHGLRNGDGRLGLVCADGGCKNPADVVKAFAAGADFVMLGGMLAGTDECEGEWEYEFEYECPVLGYPSSTETYLTWANHKHESLLMINPGKLTGRERKKSLSFYGMSSKKAQEKHHGEMASYKASEGRVKTIDFKGPVKETMEEIMGGVRSACAYSGVKQLKDLNKAAKFVRVNRTHYDQTL